MKFGVNANFHSTIFLSQQHNISMSRKKLSMLTGVNTSGELQIIVDLNQASVKISETIETQLPFLNKISQCK